MNKMNNNFGISNKSMNYLLNIFSKYPQIQEVILYGSRALGTFSKGSDIDITLKGQQTELNLKFLLKLKNEVDNLPIPYTVDISIFDFIHNESLKEHINRVGLTFYKNL